MWRPSAAWSVRLTSPPSTGRSCTTWGWCTSACSSTPQPSTSSPPPSTSAPPAARWPITARQPGHVTSILVSDWPRPSCWWRWRSPTWTTPRTRGRRTSRRSAWTPGTLAWLSTSRCSSRLKVSGAADPRQLTLSPASPQVTPWPRPSSCATWSSACSSCGSPTWTPTLRYCLRCGIKS